MSLGKLWPSNTWKCYSPPPTHPHMLARAHAHTHTHTHIHTHTHTHTHTNTHTHTATVSAHCTYAVCISTKVCMYIRTHTHTGMYRCIHVRMYVYTHTNCIYSVIAYWDNHTRTIIIILRHKGLNSVRDTKQPQQCAPTTTSASDANGSIFHRITAAISRAAGSCCSRLGMTWYDMETLCLRKLTVFLSVWLERS